MPDEFYIIPADKVAHELMEEEVIVIHFASGCYFSLHKAAALIWQWIGAGASHSQIVASFTSLSPAQEREVDAFLDQLVAEGIVEKSDQPAAGSFSIVQVPYEKPVLEIYKDMQDLMLVDPIHEVDATGWPKPLAE